MADLVAALKQLRLYGMAACYAEGLEQGQFTMTTAATLLTQLVHAEATDRATRSIRYQMHVARFPMQGDLAGFDFEQAKVDRRQSPRIRLRATWFNAVQPLTRAIAQPV